LSIIDHVLNRDICWIVIRRILIYMQEHAESKSILSIRSTRISVRVYFCQRCVLQDTRTSITSKRNQIDSCQCFALLTIVQQMNVHMTSNDLVNERYRKENI
jgi:hypothetical protein